MTQVDMLIITASMLDVYLKQAALVLLKEEGSASNLRAIKTLLACSL